MKVNKNSFKVGEPLKKGGKSSKKKISPLQALKNVFDKIPKAVESKNEDAFHEFKEKFNKMKVQTKPLKMRVDIKVQE